MQGKFQVCTPQERDFSLISLSSTSVWYLQQSWYLGRTWSRWREKKGGKDESKETGREGKAKGRSRRRRVSQKGNLRPTPSAAGSVQQSLFLDFVARRRSSRVSSSLLASFQPSRIFNEKQLYKHMVSVHKHSRGTKKNEDGESILPKSHLTRKSWLTFSLWAMPTSGDIIMAKQRSKKRKKRNPPGLVESGFQLHSVFLGHVFWGDGGGPDCSRDKHIFSVSSSANLPPWLCWCCHP